MIFGYVIYLTYSLHDKNIPGMISGQGHVMRLGQGQMWAKFKNSEQTVHNKCFKVYIIISH